MPSCLSYLAHHFNALFNMVPNDNNSLQVVVDGGTNNNVSVLPFSVSYHCWLLWMVELTAVSLYLSPFLCLIPLLVMYVETNTVSLYHCGWGINSCIFVSLAFFCVSYHCQSFCMEEISENVFVSLSFVRISHHCILNAYP